MQPNFHFNALIVSKMAPFVSNEETRYYLHGIHVMADPAGGVRLAATDDHALIIVRDPEGKYSGPESGVIVAVERHKAFTTACRKKTRSGTYLVEGDTVSGALHVRHDSAAAPEYIHPAPFIDGTYPDYTRVVPALDESKRGIVGGFNPELLYRFQGFGNFVELYQSEYEAPAIVLVSEEDAFGVIMPARTNFSAPDFWFDQPGKRVTQEVATAAE